MRQMIFSFAKQLTEDSTRAFGMLMIVVVFVSMPPFTEMELAAQTLNTGTIRGQVIDAQGAAVPGAEITISNQVTGIRREITSDGSGFYTIAGLPLTGKYKLTVARTGFAVEARDGLELRAGETATINITLSPAGTTSIITIYGTVEGVRSDAPQLGTRLDLGKIDNTPVLGRKITTLPLLDSSVRSARGTGDLFLNNTLFIINGSGRRQTSYSVDGSSGDDAWGRQTIFTNIPFSALQEFTVLTNSFSAEYGRTTGGVVNIVTKSGTNAYRGDMLYMWRPGGIQARPPLAIRDTVDILHQISGSFSGPVRRDRTHFFLAAERNDQKRDAVITSALAPGLYTGEANQELLQARIDHQFNSHNTLSGRFNFDLLKDTNPSDAVGGTVLPSAARIFRRRTYSAQLSNNTIISSSLLNEARVQFQLGSPITKFDPVNSSYQIVRSGISTEGESRSASLINHQYQFADTVSFTHGSHYLKFGGDAIYSTSGGYGQEFGSGFVLGQFTIKSTVPATTATSALTINDVQRYTQSFGNATYNVTEWLWSLFAQDSFKIRRDLTLNLGIRYERQTLTDDKNNFSPRLGFAYNLLGDKRTVIRGGYGIYYSEIRANIVAAYALNGPTGVFTFSAAPGQFGFPTSLAPLTAFPTGAVLPARDIVIRPGQRSYYNQFFDISKLKGYQDALLNPYAQQANLGFEREIGWNWFLSMDYVYQHTIRIDRTVDLNTPAPFERTQPGQTRSAAAADATRLITPVNNGFRRIQSTLNEGSSIYNGLQINLNRRFSNKFSLNISYTLSRVLNTVEADAPGGDPNDLNQLGIFERGHSVLEQPHRAVISGFYQLPHRFTLGGVATLASARGYNITTGTDSNGDGANTDRPVINGIVIGRNQGKGTAIYDVGLFIEHELNLNDRVKLSLRAESFNLFNHSNIVGRNGVYGNATTGQPLSTFGQPLGGISNVDPGRQFQLIFRARF